MATRAAASEASAMIALRAGELSAFRAAVIACALPHERERCERLLGQVASLEARADGHAAELRFAPSAGSVALARRALAHLRA